MALINLTLQGQADAALLATLGESVVARRDGGLLHLHLHSHDPEATRTALQSVGEITVWHAESMQAATLPPAAGFVRLLCDTAKSLPRPLANTNINYHHTVTADSNIKVKFTYSKPALAVNQQTTV